MFLAYFFTLAPGVYGFDSAELATGVFVQGIIHPTGYPLYLLVGKLFSLLPVRDIAYRLNLMSAFFGAWTVVLLYIVNMQITRHKAMAWLAAASFGFSNYFWQMSIVAEVYTLHTALLAGYLALLLYWRNTGKSYAILLFAFLFGLSLTNHTSGHPVCTGIVLDADYRPVVELGRLETIIRDGDPFPAGHDGVPVPAAESPGTAAAQLRFGILRHGPVHPGRFVLDGIRAGLPDF